MDIKLAGKKMHLREFKEDDWTAVHEYASNELVCRYQPWEPNTEEESRGFVQQNIYDAALLPKKAVRIGYYRFRDTAVGWHS